MRKGGIVVWWVCGAAALTWCEVFQPRLVGSCIALTRTGVVGGGLCEIPASRLLPEFPQVGISKREMWLQETWFRQTYFAIGNIYTEIDITETTTSYLSNQPVFSSDGKLAAFATGCWDSTRHFCVSLPRFEKKENEAKQFDSKSLFHRNIPKSDSFTYPMSVGSYDYMICKQNLVMLWEKELKLFPMPHPSILY